MLATILPSDVTPLDGPDLVDWLVATLAASVRPMNDGVATALAALAASPHMSDASLTILHAVRNGAVGAALVATGRQAARAARDWRTAPVLERRSMARTSQDPDVLRVLAGTREEGTVLALLSRFDLPPTAAAELARVVGLPKLSPALATGRPTGRQALPEWQPLIGSMPILEAASVLATAPGVSVGHRTLVSDFLVLNVLHMSKQLMRGWTPELQEDLTRRYRLVVLSVAELSGATLTVEEPRRTGLPGVVPAPHQQAARSAEARGRVAYFNEQLDVLRDAPRKSMQGSLPNPTLSAQELAVLAALSTTPAHIRRWVQRPEVAQLLGDQHEAQVRAWDSDVWASLMVHANRDVRLAILQLAGRCRASVPDESPPSAVGPARSHGDGSPRSC